MRDDSGDDVFDFEKERALAASYGATLLPPDYERYPPGSTTIIVRGVPRREPCNGERVQVCITTGEPGGDAVAPIKQLTI